jgi:acetyl esterase/lipase
MQNNPGPSKIARRTFLGVGGAAALASPLRVLAAAGQAPDSSAVKVEKGVVYGKGGDTDLHCDIYRPPPGTEKRMALIHLYGGGFRGGSIADPTLPGKVTPVTALGYVSIAAQYRLTGEAKFPAMLHDVKTAIRWARANATSLGIDPKRVAVVGYSAGGFLALAAAGTMNRPEFEGEGGNPKVGSELAACVAFYPRTEIFVEANGTPHILLPPGSDAAAHRAASPTTYVSPASPPTILYHGLTDMNVPPESSYQFLQLLREAKVASELHTFAGVPHEFDTHPEFAQATAVLTDFFLERHVLHPRTYPPFGPGGGRGGRGRGSAAGG